MRKWKNISLAGGVESGRYWELRINLSENIRSPLGHFAIDSEKESHHEKFRRKDRGFFERRLGFDFMSDKVLHHDWKDKDGIYWVRLLNKDKHPNGDVGRKTKRWEMIEEWLIKEGKNDVKL